MSEHIPRTRLVLGCGPYDAPLWFIGMAPAEEEEKAGEPFRGAAGWRLDLGFKEVGIIRDFVRLDNCFKVRPPTFDCAIYFKDKKQQFLTETGWGMLLLLKKDLEEHRPNCIVALGALPLRLLTGKEGIDKWRGSVLPCTLVPGLKVYPTYHPSYVNRMMQEKGKKDGKRGQNVYPIFLRDLQRAVEQSQFPEIKNPQRNFILPRTADECVAWLQGIPRDAKVACDIENLKDCAVITRVGFSYEPDTGISIPFVDGGGAVWSIEDFKRILLEISRAFLREDLTFIFQNLMHDLQMLGHFWKMRVANVEDTMFLIHATHPHLPKGLDFITSVYTWEPYYKDQSKQNLSIYNIRDCCVTREAFPMLEQEAHYHQTYEGYKRTMSYVPSLLAMSTRGIRCDLERRERIKQEFEERLAELDEEIMLRMGASEPYNITAGQTNDLVRLLYQELNLPTQRNRGSVTVDDNAILMLMRLYPKLDILKTIREKRKLIKLHGTYIMQEPTAEGRYHTTYDPSGTVTWRLASYSSPIGGGMNLQNIPKRGDPVNKIDYGKEIRKLFIPDPGMEFLSSDLKQAEAMFVAWEAGEIIEIRAFENGQDVHWINAQDIFDLPRELSYDPSDKDHWLKRDVAKTVKHAGNYGMGPYKLQKILLKNGYFYSIAECKAFLAKIRNARPMIELWKGKVERQLNMDRTLVTPDPLRRRRVFYGRKGPDLLRAGLAFCPQSTVGELLCCSIRDIFEELECKQGILQILLDVHDEIVVQVPKGTALSVAKKMQPFMEREVVVNGKPLVIPCDFKTGDNWGEMKDLPL